MSRETVKKEPKPDRKNIKYSFSLNNEIFKRVNTRKKDLENLRKKNNSKAAAKRLEHAPFLTDMLVFEDTARNEERYPTGSGNGKHFYFTHKNIDFKVRLDTENGKFYPRVSEVATLIRTDNLDLSDWRKNGKKKN